jgi:hypothetical protein
MARLACRREAGRGMIRVCSAVVIAHMAKAAVGWGIQILSVHMTLNAIHRGVRTRQRKCRRRMIEGGRPPDSGTVTLRASVAELIRRMIRVGRAVIVRLVACIALGRRSRVMIIDMTLTAGNRCMRSGQMELG